MYAPFDRSSLANVGSTSDTQEVTRFILSLGDNIPKFEHCTSSLRPFPPLLRPRDLLFFGISLCFQEKEWGLHYYPLAVRLRPRMTGIMDIAVCGNPTLDELVQKGRVRISPGGSALF